MAILDYFKRLGERLRGRPSYPVSGDFAGRTYTVKRGDTLSAISLRYYGDANDYMKIYEANRPLLSDPDKIFPGQVLRIPD